MQIEELEQTLVLIKPDALKNSLTGYVLSQLAEFHTGLRFAGAKIVHVSIMLAQEHYAEHFGKIFFPSLIDYITGKIHYSQADSWKRRVIALVYQGKNAIQKLRDIAGPTNPHTARETRPGCIRSMGTISPIKDAEGKIIGERMDNLIHASANPVDAEREIKLWFTPLDIPPDMRVYPTEISDTHYYYKNHNIYENYEPGSVCLVAPGHIVWKSDYETLQNKSKGKPTTITIETVAAKYLINEHRDRD